MRTIQQVLLAVGVAVLLVSGVYSEKAPAAPLVTFIELGSVNCIPCKAMQPVMKAIEREYGDQVKVVFHDVWTKEGRPFGEQYRIQAIPTQIFLDKNGTEYFRHTGFYPQEDIARVLEQQGLRKVAVPGAGSAAKKITGQKMHSGAVCK